MSSPAREPQISEVWGSDAPLADRVAQVVRHPTIVKLIKYTSVSVISTVVSQVTLLLAFGVLRLMSEVPANLLANVVATFPSYSLNRRWVWRKGGKSHLGREVIPFWVLSFAGLGLSSLTVWGAGAYSRAHHFDHLATSVMVNVANLLAFALLWVIKFVIYNRLFRVDPVELPGEETELVET